MGIIKQSDFIDLSILNIQNFENLERVGQRTLKLIVWWVRKNPQSRSVWMKTRSNLWKLNILEKTGIFFEWCWMKCGILGQFGRLVFVKLGASWRVNILDSPLVAMASFKNITSEKSWAFGFHVFVKQIIIIITKELPGATWPERMALATNTMGLGHVITSENHEARGFSTFAKWSRPTR